MSDRTASWRLWRWSAAVLLALVLALAVASLFAPHLGIIAPYPHVVVDSGRPVLAKGRMVDDYFAVQPIGPGVWAIGEPRYWQRNYAYLIVGNRQAVLFDAGSGTRDIRPVVAGLTSLPVTVIVSHLHFDHLGGATAFGAVAMIDEPQTRADMVAGRFTPRRWSWLGEIDSLPAPTLAVSRWIKPGETLDLGGRLLKILATPGHTPTSISLYDPAAHVLFAGDYIYPTTLVAETPGASLSAYEATARTLLAQLPPNTILWTAHCCRAGEAISAPWLTMTDLSDLYHALGEVRAGRARPSGFFPLVYPVNRQMTLRTGFRWNNP